MRQVVTLRGLVELFPLGLQLYHSATLDSGFSHRLTLATSDSKTVEFEKFLCVKSTGPIKITVEGEAVISTALYMQTGEGEAVVLNEGDDDVDVTIMGG